MGQPLHTVGGRTYLIVQDPVSSLRPILCSPYLQPGATNKLEKKEERERGGRTTP